MKIHLICLCAAGERQHDPGCIGRLRWLPAPEAGHRTDGVSCWSEAQPAAAVYSVSINLIVFLLGSMRSCLGTATATARRLSTPGWPEWCTIAAPRWIPCGTLSSLEGFITGRGKTSWFKRPNSFAVAFCCYIEYQTNHLNLCRSVISNIWKGKPLWALLCLKIDENCHLTITFVI